MFVDSAPSSVSSVYERSNVEGFFDVPNDDYHSLPGISSTNIGQIMQDPKVFADGLYEDDCDSDADHFVFGTMVHEALMFPDAFKDKYAVFPGKVRRGKKWVAFKEECEEAGLITVTTNMMESCDRILEMVGDVPEHDALFTNENNYYELSTWVNDPNTGLLCKIRPDVLTVCPDSTLVDIIDIKTAPTAEFEIETPGSRYTKGFKYSVRSYGYNRQEAFYTDMIEALGYTVNSFRFFVVGKDLNGNEIYSLSEEWVTEGREEYIETLSKYNRIIMGV